MAEKFIEEKMMIFPLLARQRVTLLVGIGLPYNQQSTHNHDCLVVKSPTNFRKTQPYGIGHTKVECFVVVRLYEV